MSLRQEEIDNMAPPGVETTADDGSEHEIRAPPKIPRTKSSEVPHIGDVHEATTPMPPLTSDNAIMAEPAELEETMVIMTDQENRMATQAPTMANRTTEVEANSSPGQQEALTQTETSPSLRGLNFADAEKLLEQVISPEEPNKSPEGEKANTIAVVDSSGATPKAHIPAFLDVAAAERILRHVIPEEPNKHTGTVDSVDADPQLNLEKLSTNAADLMDEPRDPNESRGEAKVDFSRPPEEYAAIDNVPSDLTSSDSSNLLLEEKFKNLSLQAQEIGKPRDESSRTFHAGSSRSLAAKKKATSLPRVAQLAAKNIELHHTIENDKAVRRRYHASLPRVAQLPAKKTETEVPASKDENEEKATTPRKHASLPRVAFLPPKLATEKTSESVDIPSTDAGKKLAGLPRVAKIQKSARRDDNASSLSAEQKGAPAVRLSGLPRVALLPNPKGVAEKFISKPTVPVPVTRKVLPDPIDPYHYLRHTVCSAARVSSRVESRPKSGDFVTVHTPTPGESSARSPLRMTKASTVAMSPGAASNLTSIESKSDLPAGLEELVDEHDRDLEKLLSDDAEDSPHNALQSDRIDSPGRSNDEKADSQPEQASPDDVRTMDLQRECLDPLDPKNLQAAVDAANEAVAEHP